MLFQFYEASYKVLLSNNIALTVTDYFPLNIFKPNAINWLQDIVAPFYIFIKMKFEYAILQDENGLNNNKISFTSKRSEILFGKQKISLHKLYWSSNAGSYWLFDKRL